MSDYKTTRPLPSASASDPCVVYDNSVSFDKLINESQVVTTYKGVELQSVPSLLEQFEAEANTAVISLGWHQVGLFADGFTYTLQNDIAKDAAGDWYRWNGVLPKAVTAGTLPSSDANFVKIDYKSHAELSDRNPANGSAHNADDVAKNDGGTVQGFIDTSTFKTAEDAKLYQSHIVGSKVIWQGRFSQSDGGSNWGVVKTGAHTDDGGSIFSIDENTYIEANLKGKTISIAKFGAVGGVDSTAQITKALEYARDSAADETITVTRSYNGLPYLFSTLKVYTGTTFKGAGGSLKIIDGFVTDAGASYYPIHNLGETRVTYDYLVVDGNSAGNPIIPVVCDTITCVGDQSKIKNCKLTNAIDSGIMFSAVTNGYCRYNYVDTARDLCIYVNATDANTLDGSDVTHNKCFRGVYGGVGVKRRASGCSISVNFIRQCGNGITVEDFGGDIYPRNLTIVDNDIADIGYMFRGAAGLAERGISISKLEDSTVARNKIKNVSGTVLYNANCTNVSFVDNSGTGYPASPEPTEGNNGFYDGLTISTDCLFSLNRMTNIVGRAYYFNNIQSCVVDSNVGKTLSLPAMRINAESADSVVSKNVLRNGSGGEDLEYFAGANCVLKDNIPLNKTGAAKVGYDTRSAGLNYPDIGGLVPKFIGQDLLHLLDNGWWKSYGLSAGNWSRVTAYPHRTISAGQPAPNVGTVVPLRIGEEVLYLLDNSWWKSYGLAAGNWNKLTN